MGKDGREGDQWKRGVKAMATKGCIRKESICVLPITNSEHVVVRIVIMNSKRGKVFNSFLWCYVLTSV